MRLLAQRNTLVNNPVIIDGLARSGKFLLGNILSSLKDMEHVQQRYILETLPFLHRLGYMDEQTAISMMQVDLDMNAFDAYTGRNLNFRHSDKSSVYRSGFFDQYMQRCFKEDTSDVVDTIRHSGRQSLFIAHHLLCNIDICFRAFDRLKVVNILRHPVDLVSSWYKRGWGHRFGGETDFTPAVQGDKGPVPWFVSGDETYYENLKEMDRIIFSIERLIEMSDKTYQALADERKQQVLFVTYEGLITDPDQTIDKMGAFLNTGPTAVTPKILALEACHHKLDDVIEKRSKKLKEINSQASDEFRKRLDSLSQRYEETMKVGV